METKDDKSLKSLKQINLKMVLGSSPTHDSYVFDISDAIPQERLQEVELELAKDGKPFPGATGVSPSIIGAIETYCFSDGSTDRLFLPLMNPFGAFVSLEQEINRLLTGAIVNQKQLEALKESVHEIFESNTNKRRQGVEHVYMERGL